MLVARILVPPTKLVLRNKSNCIVRRNLIRAYEISNLPAELTATIRSLLFLRPENLRGEFLRQSDADAPNDVATRALIHLQVNQAS